MRRPILSGAGFIAACLFFSGAAEARGYYYNKPGVSREAYMADVGECIELAGGVRPGAVPYVYTPNIYAAGAAAFFGGMMRSRERRRLAGMVERTCMADKGYARYEVNDAVLDEIENLRTQEERIDRLFGLAAATAPIGTRTRE
jgi:hypothetical protein